MDYKGWGFGLDWLDYLSRLRGIQHFIARPRPTSVSSRACVFFLLGCSDNVVPCSSFANQNALKSDWMYRRSHGFAFPSVICSISLIRPSAVFSCSLMNAQRWGEAWKWLFQNSFFDFSGISWNFSSLINSNGFLSIKLIKKDCLSLSALLSAG